MLNNSKKLTCIFNFLLDFLLQFSMSWLWLIQRYLFMQFYSFLIIFLGEMTLSLYHQRQNLLESFGTKPWSHKIPKLFFSGTSKASNRGYRQKLSQLPPERAEVRSWFMASPQYVITLD